MLSQDVPPLDDEQRCGSDADEFTRNHLNAAISSDLHAILMELGLESLCLHGRCNS